MKTFKQIIAEVAEPKSDDEKAFKAKHVISKTADRNGNGDDVFNGSKQKKDKSKAASYEPGKDEEVYEETSFDNTFSILREFAKDVDQGMFEGWEDMLKAVKKKAAEKGTGNFEKKKISTGTVYQRKYKKEKEDVKEAVKPPFEGPYSKKSDDIVDKSGAKHTAMSRAKHLAKMALQKRLQQKQAKEEVEKCPDCGKMHEKGECEMNEKKLTPAEMKKREEVAKAIERENPNMPMDKKMAIATATAKKVAEALKGGQKKLDLNKNGKLDADDFKRLRKEEVELDESSDAYGKSLEKEKEKRLTSNDQDKLAQLRRMMDREKTKVARKPNKEDVEQVNELNKSTLQSYAAKASDARGHRNLPLKKVDNRYTGVARASKRLNKEESESIEEGIAATLKKAAGSSNGTSVTFSDGSKENLDQATAKALLGVHQKLNSTNKQKMEDNLFKSSEDFMKMVDFAMSKA